MTRGEGIMGGKGEESSRNMYKGHMDKAKGGVGSRDGPGGVVEGKWRHST